MSAGMQLTAEPESVVKLMRSRRHTDDADSEVFLVVSVALLRFTETRSPHATHDHYAKGYYHQDLGALYFSDLPLWCFCCSCFCCLFRQTTVHEGSSGSSRRSNSMAETQSSWEASSSVGHTLLIQSFNTRPLASFSFCCGCESPPLPLDFAIRFACLGLWAVRGVFSAKGPDSSTGGVPVVYCPDDDHMEEEVQLKVQVEEEEETGETHGEEQGKEQRFKERSTAQRG